MSESVAPSAERNEDVEQKESSAPVSGVREERRSLRPGSDDEEDGRATLPAPRRSTSPDSAASEPPLPRASANPPPEVASAPPPASTPPTAVASTPPTAAVASTPAVDGAAAPEEQVRIAPAAIVAVEAASPPQPAPEVVAAADPPEVLALPTVDEPAASKEDPNSMSAQVVSIDSERSRERRGKKKKAHSPRGTRSEAAVVEAPTPVAEPSRGPWLLLVGVAAAAGIWLLSRAGADDEAARRRPPPTAVAATPTVNEPPAALEAPAAEPAGEPVAAAEPAPVLQAAPPEAPAVAPEPPAAPAAESDGSEPLKITAYKAVVEATKSARNCRHRGDTPGKVPVVVEFGPDGRVQRTEVKGTFANPMTKECVASKLGALTIPPSGTSIITTAEVSMR